MSTKKPEQIKNQQLDWSFCCFFLNYNKIQYMKEKWDGDKIHKLFRETQGK